MIGGLFLRQKIFGSQHDTTHRLQSTCLSEDYDTLEIEVTPYFHFPTLYEIQLSPERWLCSFELDLCQTCKRQSYHVVPV